jgi:hypothetical protein
LGLTSPPSPVLCSATTAPCPSWVASLLARSPIPWLLPRFVFPNGLGDRRKLSATARALGPPVPLLFRPSLPRRHGALPRSRVPPVTPCPALRPRWNPAYSPWRTQDYCLPLVPPRRLSLADGLRGYPYGPQLYSFRGSITRPGVLLPPAPYSPHEACTRSSLLSCWLGFTQVGLEPENPHPLGNNDLFHRFLLHSLGLGLRLARGTDS